jgi:PhnB protein
MVFVSVRNLNMPSVQPIPAGYHSVQPYLHPRGAAQAIQFYKNAFDATERMRMPTPDGRLMHAELRIGDSVVMLADECPERQIYSPSHFGGATSSLMLYVEDCDVVYARALAAGAKSLREPTDQSYGDRMAGVEDPFGYQWWIATHIRDVSLEQMQADAEPSA